MKRFAALLALAFALPCAAALSLVSPPDGSVVPLLTDAQKEYMDMPEAVRREKLPDEGWRKELSAKTKSVPAKVKFAWKGAEKGAKCKVEIRRLPDGKVFFSGSTRKAELELDNFEIARTYEWTVQVGGKEPVAKGTFRTEDRAPRLLRLDGVPNMRDLGGRIGLGGRRVKQGMVLRSSGLNNNANRFFKPEEVLALYDAGKLLESVPETSREMAEKVKQKLDKGNRKTDDLKRIIKEWCPGTERLNDKTRAFAREQFGIKTDLDLRTDRECYMMTGSPLGPDVKWIKVTSREYDGMHKDEGKKGFVGCFKVFLDEANYPIDFHCIAGADRTGSLAYILNALLGVSDAELMLDWEITAFYAGNPKFEHRTRYDRLVAGFQKYPGSTTAEKVANYVKALGFTDADIEKFRSIMLER